MQKENIMKKKNAKTERERERKIVKIKKKLVIEGEKERKWEKRGESMGKPLKN